MFGRVAQVALIAVLVLLAYLFTLNPGLVDFRLLPGRSMRASLALVLLLTFAAGFGVAFLAGAVREAYHSFGFWRQLRRHERSREAHRLFRRGRGEALLGRTRAARTFFRKAYRKLPDEGAISLELARAEAREGDLEAAEKRLRALLQKEPESSETYAALVEVLDARGDEEGQREALTHWVKVDAEYLPALRRLRDLERKAGRWAEAVRLQEKVLSRAGARETGAGEKRLLAECLVALSRTQSPREARETLKKALSADAKFAPAHAVLADALLSAGEEQGAVEACLQGFRQSGRVGLLLKAEGVRLRRGEGEEMLATYRKLGRKDAAIALLRARLLLTLNRSEEALDVLKQVPEAQASAAGRWLAGEASFRLRSYEGAARAFRRSIDAEEGPPPLAFACDSCGRAASGWAEACPACGALGTLELATGQLPPA